MASSVLMSGPLTRASFGQMTFLEHVTDSRTITVFFHGLGLDASDYREYLETHETHAIAVNLAGYAPDGEDRLPPVPVQRHVEMVAQLIEKTGRDKPDKKIILVGFSLGADLVLQLAEHWAATDVDRRPGIEGALMLDPNVNRSTMTISRLFSDADQNNPTDALKDLIGMADNTETLRALCGYASKVATKDFRQIQQMATDMMNYWEPAGYDQFGSRVAHVANLVKKVRIAVSADYEEHMNGMQEAFSEHGLGPEKASIRLTDLGHFGLIGNEFLSEELRRNFHVD